MFCPKCGTNVGDFKFCHKCGAAITAHEPRNSVITPEPLPQTRGENGYDFGNVSMQKLPDRSAAPLTSREMTPAGSSRQTAAKPVPVKAVALIAVLVVVIGLFAGYFSSYKKAVSYAEKGDYSAAEDCLKLPALTELHDKQIAVYIEAGKRMEKKDYGEAKDLFESIPGYLDADTMVLEADYRHAEELLDEEDFDAAIEKYEKLAEQDYEDAREKLTEARYQKGLYIMDEEQDYLAAYAYLTDPEYDDRKGVETVREELKEKLYAEGVAFYREGKLGEAEKRFLDGYKDSDKYQYLIQVKNTAYWTGSNAAQAVQKLKKMFYFEDTSEVLVSVDELACEFLMGDWKTSNGSHYFNMQGETGIYSYYSSYNIPWYGGTFTIEDGVYMVTQSNYTDKPQYRFTLLTPDSMDLYCYKDGKTYKMYRR